MKSYQGKTVEEAIAAACEELGVSESQLIFSVQDKKVGLFSKKFVIDVYEFSDVVRFAEDYILAVNDSLGIESSVKTKLNDYQIGIKHTSGKWEYFHIPKNKIEEVMIDIQDLFQEGSINNATIKRLSDISTIKEHKDQNG